MLLETFSEFKSYVTHPLIHQETIHTADGTTQSITCVEIVRCTPNIDYPVLHVLPLSRCIGRLVKIRYPKNISCACN
jgi:hypothetical protein